jgi:hypothetical protein
MIENDDWFQDPVADEIKQIKRRRQHASNSVEPVKIAVIGIFSWSSSRPRIGHDADHDQHGDSISDFCLQFSTTQIKCKSTRKFNAQIMLHDLLALLTNLQSLVQNSSCAKHISNRHVVHGAEGRQGEVGDNQAHA